ncbi:DUF11 domain-containing protein [Spirosoma sp. BT702]|uniref:DUF11 domain-containing protein n=1 Tax=Spirosoma profusum TaxID=2771354 RepID=A0A926XVJ4_9BACT|nr:SdrD B-like domain-containing protein [Spirosoma profusum]MBD2700531.1 DUF11 domain-containing protein [Spirosoma profusum]
MNEQFLLNKSPHHDSRLAKATGKRPRLVESSGTGSLNRLLSSLAGYTRWASTPALKGACSFLMFLLSWVAVAPAHAQAPTVDLVLHKKIDNQAPAIGSVVTYTITVVNSASSTTTATGILVKDELPVGGVTYLPGSASALRGTATFTPPASASVGTGTWSIASIAPNDSVVLVLQATVIERGVWFNTAEIAASSPQDINSVPDNQNLTEDDYDAVCFSVPILWYVGDEYTVTIPSGYNQIVWFRDDVPISASAVSTSLAQVNNDGSLTIKSPGTYRFVTYQGSCPSTNCCDIKVIQGPYGSLGDYVWVDANNDGIQGPTASEPGIDGVLVYLYDQSGTVKLDSTLTAGGGKYLFDSLTDGSYIVRFIAPSGYSSTSANVGLDDLDSDADGSGVTGIYTIDTSQPESSTARNNLTVDAGFYLPTATLGDYVWLDANHDGQQDSGEDGIPGVTVTLVSNGTVVATTTTDGSGLYSFTGLTPGVPYSVSFTTPVGMTATLANTGPDGTDSDPVAGITDPVTLTVGENNLSIDAGFYFPTATLGDYVWLDVDRDGQLDSGEVGIQGVTVTLVSNGTVVATTTTNASGLYSFTGLTPGIPYSVSFTTPVGMTATLANQGSDDSDSDPIGGTTDPVTLTAGENNLSLDAGFYFIPATLGNLVFADNNSNGIQDAGDIPISGVTVTLISNGTVVATTTTNLSGEYSFTGLTPGVPYSVSFTAPTGYTATAMQAGGTDATDSDANPITGLTRSVTLAPGQTNNDIDAGYTPPTSPIAVATLGDYVWVDLNGDGQQQVGEPPLSGVTVTLINNGTVVATTTTDVGGAYSFTIIPGVPYSVSFTAPTGYSVTAANQGPDASDSDPVGGITDPVTLTAGQVNTTIDAGFTPIYDVGIAKSVVSAGPYFPGSSIQYQLTVTNNSIVPVYNVRIDDILPAGVSFASGTGFSISGASSVSALVAGPLAANGGTASLTLTVAVSNAYSLSNVVNVGVVSRYTSTTDITGTPAIDSNPNNNTATVTVPLGQYATLGDYVWVDTDQDGQQDGNETGLASVTVTLVSNNSVVATMITDGSGAYSFTGLTPGVPYSVSFTAPAGYTATVANQGPDGSDSDPVGGITDPVTLTAGQNNNTIDAGFYTTPTCPTNFGLLASNDLSICTGETVSLTATTTASGAQIHWFMTPTDGVAFDTTASGEALIVSPTAANTIYYAEAFTTSGCVSPREPVSVTVITVATPVIAGNLRNTCPATTANLSSVQIQNQTAGVIYEWHTSATTSQATLVTNLTAVGAGQYYLFAKSGNCYSSPAVLTVQIDNCNCQNVAGVTVSGSVTICSGGTVPVRATLSGSATAVIWSTNGTGGFASPNSLTTTYLPSVADIAAGTVLLTATTNDPDGPGGVCQAATSSLIVRITPKPDAPVGVACDDTLVCQGSSTKLVGFAPNGRINWYNQAGQLIGTTVSGGKLVVTPATTGQVIYTAEAVSPEGCVSDRTSLTITVGQCLADLEIVKGIVTPGPYTVGQKITYSLTASNNGPVTATDVRVIDILSPSLTFVSSTPAGQYSPATGVWNIGTLTAGSNRNLLIEATITGGTSATSVNNTAIIGGTNNDPKYPLNDTSRVVIPINPCVAQAPIIDCAITEICRGGTTTLKAIGCEGGNAIWSDGKTGKIIFVAPTVTTTYTASCVVGNCTSTASNSVTITVVDPQAPVITASADQVCPGTSVTLTASGCTSGTVVWSDRAQTGTSIVVIVNSKTTYTAQCQVAGCLSNPAIKTIDIATDIPRPTIVASSSVVCPGETVTLTVENCVGTPVWNSTTATTASITVIPTATNNSYSVYCKNDACTSASSQVYSVSVVSPRIPTVTASADTICSGSSVVLTATGCNGTIQWSNGVTGVSSITVNPNANISYYAECKFRTCVSAPSNTVDVVVLSLPTPEITADKSIVCSGEKVVLTATGCLGTVKWYGIDRLGASIEIYPTQTTEYYATCKVGACESDRSTSVRVTVNTSTAPAPTIAASATSICSGGLVSLTATGCTSGTVVWSDGQMGSVVSVTPTVGNSSYYALCKVGTACGTGRSNVININITTTPKPTIVRCICSADTVCAGEEVELSVKNCQGTPHWSTGETTTTIFVSPTVTTGYTVYCQDGVCVSPVSETYTITVVPVTIPTITASATSVSPGGSVTLTASGCNGTVIWSANDINGNDMGTSIVVQPNGTQTYYARCKFRVCLSEPSNTIIINPGDCAVRAGALVPVSGTVCSGADSTVVIGATPNGGLIQPASYSVVYALTQSGIVQQISALPQFTVPSTAASYIIHTLVYNGDPTNPNYVDLSVVQPNVTTASDLLSLIRNKCAALDTTGAPVVVSSIPAPVLSAGPSITVCSGGVVSLTATGCVGGTVTWSDNSVGATIQKTIYSNTWLTATCTINGCTSPMSERVNIVLGNSTIPVIVTDKPVACVGEVVSLTATGCTGGAYTWSDGQTGAVISFTASADVSYRVKCAIGDCVSDWSATNTIEVGKPAAPTISIVGVTGNSTTACFGAPVTLTAEGCGPNSYVTWSNNQVGTSITVSLASSATFSAACCNSTLCKSDPSNVVEVIVTPKVNQPTVVDKTNTCPFNTVDLSTAVSSSVTTAGGVFEFYTDASLSVASKVANPAAVGTGTYYVVERTVNGCMSLPVAIHVQITTCQEQTPCSTTNPATASAGPDASICAAKTYQLAGVMGGAGSTAHWTTSGTGTFDNAFALNAVYTASAEDVLSGRVTLTLSVSTNNAACPVATDDMVLTINGSRSVPVVTIVGATSLCYGDSVILKAPAGAAGYLWSNNARTQDIVVKVSGVYSVQLLDANGCSSVKSDNVVVHVSDPVMPPLVHNLRNECPSKIVDLTKALSTTNVGSTYVYQICACVTSNIIARPDSVCEGTYWIVERNAAGCRSAPAKVVVKVFDCASDTLQADVSIAKLASTAFVQNGTPVTYTLTVSNAGPHTAKNIDVRDVLPVGLELVNAGPTSYTVSNGIITKRIDSLNVGQSESIVFAARIVKKGVEIVNKAEITYLDNKDANLVNNTSSVTVKDTSAHKASLVGLAKAVMGTPTTVGDSLIRVSYSFVATNFGDDTLRNVQVVDDLSTVFAPNTVVSTTLTASGTNVTLQPNLAFTGTGSNANLFDSTSYIAPGKSQLFVLDVLVQRTAGDTTNTFNNVATITALNSLTSVSDASVNGGDPDPDADGNPGNNTSASSFTLGSQQPFGPSIGVALAVVKVEQQPDSSYNVTYKVTIKNNGDVALKGVSVTDSLIRAFTAPASYSVVGAPVVGAGSTLIANSGFDGNTQPDLLTGASELAAGAQDTVLITVNVKTNGNNGPFYSNATATGHTPDSTQTVKDVSNVGLDPVAAGSAPTTVRFDLPKALLGVAKSVGTPTLVEDGVYDIPYIITLSNLGTVALTKVQVEDKLSETFGSGALIVSNRIPVTSTGSVAVDTMYSGQGMITNLLVDSLSTLDVGAKASLNFVVRVDVKNADTLTFYNTAKATAIALDSTGTIVEDVSTAGTNDDPDYDLDPRNNNQPTPVALNALSNSSFIGVAMAVRDTVRQADGTFNVTYQIVVKNYGPDSLKNVTVTDSLAKVFSLQTGATYTLVGAPVITSTGSALKLNPSFNGDSDPVIVLGDSTSTLGVGQADTILVVVNVATNGTTTTFLNSAYAQAMSKAGQVSDVSTNGLNPDLNDNQNPTDSNEREATPLNLPATNTTVFIPQGFSPNGDGINDLFVIRGTAGMQVSMEVYNRWGHMVYQNNDYKNDWDGKPNNGIAISSDPNGLPDGTYYYIITLSDGRKFVRYMTINR